MSADNRCICPRCKARNDKLNETRVLDAGDKYGKIPAEEYIALAKDVAKPLEIKETFREDFYIGIDEDGGFYVSYRGACQECDAEFSYKFEQKSAIQEPTQ